jgi:hypothetical protein
MMGLALGALFLSACALGVVDTTSGGAGGDETGGAGGAGAQGGAGAEAGQGGTGGQGGGEAGMGGTGGTGGAASSSSSTGVGGGQGGSGAGVPMNCGNGVIDPGEQCDGSEFGGKTCSSIGLGSGNLICNAFCGLVASGCVPKESCMDFQDNDQDGLVDCLDDDCFMALICTDSCAQPTSVSAGNWISGNTMGRPSVISNSCSSSSGAEVVFQFKAPVDGPITVSVNSWLGIDFSVALRATCGDAASELLCSDKGKKPGESETEVLTFEATADTTYFIVVDGAQGASGPFDMTFEVPQPEWLCADLVDDDKDGLIDCDDPTACQGMGECKPGAGKTGGACSKPSECAANANDPVCLDDEHGFPGGYCSEWCDLAVPDCAGDAVCADIGLKSKHGVCLDGCSTDSECRVGYSCVDKGFSSKVCALGPEADCTNAADDDKDSFTDCEDSDCQSKAECVPGSKATGLPCTASNECYAGQNDPICIDDVNAGWPGGYCSEFCNVNEACGPGSICAQWFALPSGASTCLRVCLTDSQCRPGYFCLDVGAKDKVCVY